MKKTDENKTTYKKRRKVTVVDIAVFLFLIFIAFVMLVPFIWMVSAAFKNNSEIFEYPVHWIPKVFRLENFKKVFTEINFSRYFLNTLFLAVVITAIQCFTCSLAGFTFTKMRFRGRDVIFFCYLATMMIPWHAIMIPQFIVIKTLKLYNTHWSLILTQAFSAFGVFLMRQNMMSIPDSLHEAAKIDGASYFKTYIRIILPLSKNALMTLIVLTFNSVWNDYLGPLIYLDSERLRNIQLGLAYFQQEHATDYAAIMAGTVISVIPIIIVYAIAQKRIVEAVAFSGVKG